ncbi:MAG: Parallel beta-helix repeat protein [Pseudonocardiales bacterium]|nr:Parallel beta-helix repeat protein [Pseudonocardiales bacterium]
MLRDSLIENSGLASPSFREGIYLGSAVSNWPTWAGAQPDRSDRNEILDNHHIDIKEGTTAGIIRGNDFRG